MVHKVLSFVLFCFVPYFLKSVTGIKLKNLLKTNYLPFSIFDAVFFYFLVNDGLNCLQVILFLFFVCLFVCYWGFFKILYGFPSFLNRFVFLLAWLYLSSHIWQLMAQITKKRTNCCTPFLKPQTKQPTEQPSAGYKHTNWLLEGLSLHMHTPCYTGLNLDFRTAFILYGIDSTSCCKHCLEILVHINMTTDADFSAAQPWFES